MSNKEMTAKEMFKALGYDKTTNNDDLIEYIGGKHIDGDYVYISFHRIWKRYEVGYYDGYHGFSKSISIKEHEAIIKQLKELGWI